MLRRWPKTRYEELAGGGNLYSTSIFVLISAVMKIAREQRLEPGVKLYRGLGGDKAFPPFFHRSDPKGRKGILEWGFMSTTTSKEIAAQYSGIKEGKPLPTIFAMDAGAVDRGAVISDFSQYPGAHSLQFSSLRPHLTIVHILTIASLLLMRTDTRFAAQDSDLEFP